MDNPNVFTDDHVRVEFVELGEGRDGEYDPNDPTDIELLRFDIYVDGNDPAVEVEEGTMDVDGWYQIRDGSYCCGIPVDATEEQKQAALRYIHEHIGNPPRKLSMQAMSWIALDHDGNLYTKSADELNTTIKGH